MNPIQTKRLLLRNFRRRDAEDLYRYMNFDSVVRYSPYVRLTHEQAEAEAIAREQNDSLLAIELKETGAVIGEFVFAKGEFDAWEIGFFLNPAYQKKGYAQEAAQAMMVYAFEMCTLRRLTARCDARNAASEGLLLHLGFHKEGVLRRHLYFKTLADGTPDWADTCLFGLLKEEWQRAKCNPAPHDAAGV